MPLRAPLTAGLALSALPALAERVTCEMTDGAALTFDIDRSQFSPARDPKEPPRQQRTVVRYGDTQFPAAPFFIGDTRGFEAEGLGGTTTLFVMQPSGAARLSNARAGTELAGICTVTQGAE